MMRHASAATVVALIVLTGASLHLRAADPDKQTRPIKPKEFAGKWVRAVSIEEALGYSSELPGDEIELKIDERLGERWDREQRNAYADEAARHGNRLAGSGQFAMSKLAGHPWEAFVTRGGGSTYVSPVLPQVGAVHFRIALVRGKTGERDLLFVEFQHGKERDERIVSAYKRKAPGEKAMPE